MLMLPKELRTSLSLSLSLQVLAAELDATEAL